MSSDEEATTNDGSTDLTDQLALMSHVFDPSADRNAWKQDKVCSVCYQSFSMMGNGKKHYCKFCFRGVCGNCSMHKGLQPERNAALRICDNCYHRGIEDQVKSNFERELEREKQETLEVEENIKLEKKNNNKELLEIKLLKDKIEKCKQELTRKETELANQAASLKDDMKNMESDSDALYENLEIIKNEIRTKESKIAALREELQGVKKQCEVDRKRVMDLKNAIDEQEKENLKVQESLNLLEDKEKRAEENNLNVIKAEKDVKLKIQKTKEQLEEARKDNENLRKRLLPLRQERDRRVSELEELENKVQETREEEKRTTDQVKYLKEKSEAQKQEIIRLQAKVNKNNEAQELVDGHSSETSSVEPEARGRCKCIIQ
ncbi:unnamed protein product [Blepharisma stoltei]|uniref:FYVE-type domain-containing protein n=1 Tax=Blepharisma stoltei TaxID=1481888 RepID=A0AAU9K768_9CILI|nr:unnamed protein product [Blepharisma stoltei]